MSATRSSEGWIARLADRPTAVVELLCFPAAGSGPSSFKPWLAQVPDHVALSSVRLPGRESRAAEQPCRDWTCLLDGLVHELDTGYQRPLVLLGHCTGATVAFEVARELRRRGLREPSALVVAGSRSPQKRRGREWPRTRADLIATLAGMGGTPREVLADESLMDLVLPTLAADLELEESYAYRLDEKLDIPVIALHGRDDSDITLSDVSEWDAVTSRPITAAEYPGGHFLSPADVAMVVEILMELLPGSLDTKPLRRPSPARQYE